jgi:tryptophan synthase beta chain
VDDQAALDGFEWLARREGILPALESSHAIAWAARQLPTLPDGTIMIINLSGRGDKDVETVRRLLGDRHASGGPRGSH